MTVGAGEPAFGLSFDPRALTDLLQAPSDIRDLTLAYLQEVVNAQRFGQRLDGDLEGFRKLFVDRRKDWRVVYAVRPAPVDSVHHKEIHVVAIRPRAGNDVYDTVGARLGMSRRPRSARTHAARSRSPQLTTRTPVPRPAPPPTGLPDPPRRAPKPAHRPTR
ncbi:type II toxin-antitoxin system RelE family toxin [Streptomyces olivaceus]|uniref:type II toxin-antitoxin system RelE family toxin n=1 Tax=Streptomyces olivaceus TaxID=47716 RepID=UPI0036BD8364